VSAFVVPGAFQHFQTKPSDQQAPGSPGEGPLALNRELWGQMRGQHETLCTSQRLEKTRKSRSSHRNNPECSKINLWVFSFCLFDKIFFGTYDLTRFENPTIITGTNLWFLSIIFWVLSRRKKFSLRANDVMSGSLRGLPARGGPHVELFNDFTRKYDRLAF
jgi:hypothetical protein